MLKELNHFVVLIDKQNMTGAAEYLGVTQPGLSKSIKRLETHLGIQLVERLPRGIRATAAGLRIYSLAKSVHSEMQNLELEAVALQVNLDRQIRVGTSPLWNVVCIPKIVEQFHKAHPEVKLTIRVDQHQQLVDTLCEGELDFALCGTNFEVKRETIGCEQLTDIDMLIACSKSHTLMSNWSGSLEELHRYNWIDYQSSLAHSDQKQNNQPTAIQFERHSSLSTDSWLCGLLVAAQCGHLMTLPNRLGEFLAPFGLGFLPNSPTIASFPAGLWYRKSILTSKAGRTFKDEATSILMSSN